MSKDPETTSEDKPKKKRTYNRKASGAKCTYTRKPKGEPPAAVTDTEPVTDRDGMEAIVAPEVKPDRVREIPPPPPPPVLSHRENLKLSAVTMDIVPSVGPSLTDDFIASEDKKPRITMQNTAPQKFPWQTPKEKKNTKSPRQRLGVFMSDLPSRRKG